MPGAVSLDTRELSVAPGQEATVTVRIRNLGHVVDGFVVDILGEPAAWSYADPPEIRLFPSTDGTIVVHFKPAAEKGPVAGAHPFAVRVRSREDLSWVTVEEGTVEVTATLNVTVEIRPKTSSGRKTGKHQVIIDNHSNTPAFVQLVGDDTDDLLSFRIEPSDVELPPGMATIVDLRAKLVSKPPGGAGRVPFVVNVLAGGKPAASTDAAFAPKKLPWRPIAMVAILAIAAIIALIIFRRADVTTGTQTRVTDQGETTVTTPPSDTTATTAGGKDTTTTDGGGNNGGNGDDAPVVERFDAPQVVLASETGSGFDLVLANVDGTEAVALTAGGDDDVEPAVSPDGTKLVFASGDINGNTDLFIVDLEACVAGDLETCQPEALTDTPQPEGNPDWSPDGERIVFARNTTFGTRAAPNHELILIDPATGGETQLTTQPGSDIKPQFSPNGSLLIFERQGASQDIAVFDLRALTVRPVVRSQGFSSPHWVDDDTVVAVRPGGAESGTLVEVDVNNLTRAPVTRDLFTEPEVDLVGISPDGGRILFVSGTDLFVANRDGGGREQVSQGVNVFNADLFEP